MKLLVVNHSKKEDGINNEGEKKGKENKEREIL